MRRASIGLLGVCLAMTGPAGHPHAQQAAFRGRTDLVSVDVSVRRGKLPVPGLTAQDFEVLDNGVRQHVELETMATIPVDVTFVIDGGHWSEQFARIFVAGSSRTIAEWLRPGDRLRVITFKRDVRELVPLLPVERWATGQTVMEIDARTLVVPSHEVFRYALFDALILAVAVPPEVGRRQLAIAFVTGANAGIVLDANTLLNVVTRCESLVHVIMSEVSDPVTVFSPELEYSRDAIARAAVATGGEVHDALEGVGAFKSILADFRQSYVLTYTLAGVPREGWHTLSVRVPKYPGYRIEARSGYLGK